MNSASEAAQAVDIANAFVGIAAGGAASRGAVINNLTIRGKDQVMLRVTVVEVARTVLKQFGVSLSGSWSGLNLANTAPSPSTARSSRRATSCPARSTDRGARA